MCTIENVIQLAELRIGQKVRIVDNENRHISSSIGAPYICRIVTIIDNNVYGFMNNGVLAFKEVPYNWSRIFVQPLEKCIYSNDG